MNERLTTRDLVELLAAKAGMDKKRADMFIGALSSYISKGIEKNKIVKILGLGTFKVVLVRERESVHIQTGERFIIPAHHKLSFVPDKDFKEHINRPFAFFEPIEAVEEHKPKKVFFKKDNDDVAERKESPDPVVSVEEETSDLTASVIEAPVDDDIRRQAGGDYFTEADYDFESVEGSDEGAGYTEPVSIDDSYNDDNDGEDDDSIDANTDVDDDIDTDDSVDVEPDNTPQTLEEKKKPVSLWLWCLIVSLPIFLGSGLGAYLFLHYNSDRSSANDNFISAYDSEMQGDVPSPVGFTYDDTDITDTIALSDGFLLLDSSEDTAENERLDLDSVRNTEESTSGKRENKPVIDWLAPSPENPRSEPRRANRPNEEIERRNREITKTSNVGSSSGNARTSVAEKATTEPAAKDKIIPATIRLTSGSSLRQIAQEYYGDRAFWVYIYEYNKERISNYNNIPVGTEIRLPLPRTYGINAKSASSIRKAEQKQSELYRNSPNN